MNQLVVIPLEDLKVILEEILNTKKLEESPKESPAIMDIKETSEFLKLSLSSIYTMTSKRIIPHFKLGRKLYFNQLQLLEWICEGKRESISQALSKI
jgi:predicted DNA-binding transcriptional regulator AlpA